ncbi:MAG: diphthamide biosynthesis enzyme Dph2 [Methanomicrobiales archaeon]|nr:diphthamide biosynthesis enzyme Dph2 [Methanomicrobiales archaeon]
MDIQIDGLIEHLRRRGVRRVGLQFPEGLKRKAYGLAVSLKRAGFEPLVSGNPCYGACDIDHETLAMSDILVHFGHAPLCGNDRVLFEPVFIAFDIRLLDRVIPWLKDKRVRVTTTVQHVQMVHEVLRYLKEQGIDATASVGGSRTPYPGQVLGCSFGAARGGSDEILFIGSGLFHPTGIAIATGKRVIALDPLTGEVREVSGERFLRRRHAMIERAKGAGSVGILLSTKPGQKRLELARRMAALTERAVVVVMEEVTPEGLLNLGLDCYVNTACPRLAYDDSIRFAVPVLSPPEFEILCGVRGWQEYQIDEFCQ